MASSHFLCFALILALTFSAFGKALGAPSLNPATDFYEQTSLLKKPISFPNKFPPKMPIKLPKFNLHPKKSIGIPKEKLPQFPTKPAVTANNFEQSKTIPEFFAFAPFLSNPSLPFPDLPLVPALPLTPPSMASPTASTDQTRTNKLT